MPRRNIRIAIPELGTVSGLIDESPDCFARLVLAHGAGAGMEHATMENLVETLVMHGVATLRYQFPYMEAKRKRPDTPKVAVQTVAAAVNYAAKLNPPLPLFAGGRSFGGRMTSTAASQGLLLGIQGIVCFGFPLHRPKEPAVARAEHLKDVAIPILWLQGTRDEMAEVSLVKKVQKRHRGSLQVHFLEGADHGFAILKSSGRTAEQVAAEVGTAVAKFCRR